jgi:hypothetical protein
VVDPTRFMTEVFATWIERDVAARRASIEAHFRPDVQFFDHDGAMAGHAALETFSDSLQRRFPAARFSLARPPEVLGDALRAYWTFGPPEKPAAVDGMDFAIFDGDKIKTLYAFVNVRG